eukprot:TRINITY_DN3144_c0_g1_i1.p1 TRINITY_DN3144_c0_g1~~TRINITY_DN3144_c0_g1_i1.p1  ORF type:complete len:290 (-),score=54.89 TRINITY_DN3144_c0_g1_i1:25-894(-)
MLSSDWRVYIATLWHVTAVGVAVLAFAAPVLYEKEYAPRIETPWGWPMLTLGSWNVCCTAIFFVVCALSDVWPHWEGLRRKRDFLFILTLTEATNTLMLSGTMALVFVCENHKHPFFSSDVPDSDLLSGGYIASFLVQHIAPALLIWLEGLTIYHFHHGTRRIGILCSLAFGTVYYVFHVIAKEINGRWPYYFENSFPAYLVLMVCISGLCIRALCYALGDAAMRRRWRDQIERDRSFTRFRAPARRRVGSSEPEIPIIGGVDWSVAMEQQSRSGPLLDVAAPRSFAAV